MTDGRSDICQRCDDLYADLTWCIFIEGWWDDVRGTSHIVTKGRSTEKRILCSGDRLVAAERYGSVPVMYGVQDRVAVNSRDLRDLLDHMQPGEKLASEQNPDTEDHIVYSIRRLRKSLTEVKPDS